ncbi:phosphoenolpyruvate phosphomutase-domain-containing protein [Xylariales sp. PMI_506]|nr:phosphoenolpyruvate phosphomutase-domain-containing protein [Xylariales sp. PMI_506]
MSTANQVAQTLKALHQRSHKPLVFANVFDVLSARTIAALPAAEAIATASYGVARAAGTTDDDLTLETNLAAVRAIAAAVRDSGKPLSVDVQDGYGSELESAIGALLDLGVSGVNLEDCDKATGELYDADTAAERVRRVLEVARSRGVPDFVVNARCDVLVRGGQLEEVVRRGRKYLDAGATTVFVWGAGRGLATDEVKQLVEAFDGRLNVILKQGGLTVKELADIGVARISVGPRVQSAAIAAIQKEAETIFNLTNEQ